MNHGSLFTGIGGFDLAAECPEGVEFSSMGWQNMFHCEINPWSRRLLNYYWPKAKSYEDIKKTDFTIWRGRIDILTGGFPCQPYSTAGKRKGKDDERHLWPEMLRAIREIQPRWIVGENVLGIVSWDDGLVFEEVQSDLEAEGYKVQPFVLPAAGVNAPHQRYRVWFIAYAHGAGSRTTNGGASRRAKRENGRREKRNVSKPFRNSRIVANAKRKSKSSLRIRKRRMEWSVLETSKRNKETIKSSGRDGARMWSEFERFPISQPTICKRDDGISSRLDSITFSSWRNESVSGSGNAIVPQVALQIFKAINEYESK